MPRPLRLERNDEKTRVQTDDRQQGHQEQGQSSEVVKEALGRSLTQIICDQDQRDDPDEVGKNGDRDDQRADDQECDQVVAVAQVNVEQADRRQGDDGVEARASCGDKQLVIGDLDSHAGARDRIAEAMKQRTPQTGRFRS